MTAERKVIRAKIGLLELGKPLGNVSHACRIMGCSRDSFCRFQVILPRFCGAFHAFAGGFFHAQDTSTLLAGVPAADR